MFKEPWEIESLVNEELGVGGVWGGTYIMYMYDWVKTKVNLEFMVKNNYIEN